MRTPSRMPMITKIAMRALRLIQTMVELTDDETPFFVSIRPCTIHGCRPFSVSNQPAVVIRKGTITDHVASSRKNRDRSSLCRHTSHAPQSPNMNISTPRYAMTRIDQYCTKLLGM